MLLLACLVVVIVCAARILNFVWGEKGGMDPMEEKKWPCTMYVKFVLRFYRKSFQMFSYGERREDGRRDEKKWPCTTCVKFIL